MNGAVGLGLHETIPLEPAEGAADRDVADAKVVGEIDDTGLASFSNEVVDRLHVVLGEFFRVGFAHALEAGCRRRGWAVFRWVRAAQMGGLRVLREGREGLWANVVFDAFGVELGGIIGDTDGEQEAQHDGVARLRGLGHGAAGIGQIDRAVWGGDDQSVTLEAVDGSTDSDMADAKALCEVADACFPILVLEIRDGLYVVFRRFGSVGPAYGCVSIADAVGR